MEEGEFSEAREDLAALEQVVNFFLINPTPCHSGDLLAFTKSQFCRTTTRLLRRALMVWRMNTEPRRILEFIYEMESV